MDEPDAMVDAVAHVVRGGNRLLRIVAHVVCRDVNGEIIYGEDAACDIQIPRGSDLPVFYCERVESYVVEAPWE